MRQTDRYRSNNVISHAISSFCFDRNSWLGNISSWINRSIIYYKLPVVEIIFLSTTNFTFPQALFYNINSLADAFRCSETRQIKLTSCGFSLTAAEHTLSSVTPPETTNIPLLLRPSVTNMRSKYYIWGCFSTTHYLQYAEKDKPKVSSHESRRGCYSSYDDILIYFSGGEPSVIFSPHEVS